MRLNYFNLFIPLCIRGVIKREVVGKPIFWIFFSICPSIQRNVQLYPNQGFCYRTQNFTTHFEKVTGSSHSALVLENALWHQKLIRKFLQSHVIVHFPKLMHYGLTCHAPCIIFLLLLRIGVQKAIRRLISHEEEKDINKAYKT